MPAFRAIQSRAVASAYAWYLVANLVYLKESSCIPCQLSPGQPGASSSWIVAFCALVVENHLHSPIITITIDAVAILYKGAFWVGKEG